MSQRVPMLVYHHVYPDGDPGLAQPTPDRATGTIAESELRRHLSYIAGNGWEVVNTSRGRRLARGPRAPARKGGGPPLRQRVARHAHGIHAGAARDGHDGDLLRDQRRHRGGREGSPGGDTHFDRGAVQKPCITWRQAEELLREGWEIGAHTATHPKLAEVLDEEGPEAMMGEVERSNESYRVNLGFVPDHFAYPSGSRDDRTDAMLGPHYRSLRRWTFSHPPRWEFTDGQTAPHALECQNIDNTVGYEDFVRIFEEAAA